MRRVNLVNPEDFCPAVPYPRVSTETRFTNRPQKIVVVADTCAQISVISDLTHRKFWKREAFPAEWSRWINIYGADGSSAQEMDRTVTTTIMLGTQALELTLQILDNKLIPPGVDVIIGNDAMWKMPDLRVDFSNGLWGFGEAIMPLLHYDASIETALPIQLKENPQTIEIETTEGKIVAELGDPTNDSFIVEKPYNPHILPHTGEFAGEIFENLSALNGVMKSGLRAEICLINGNDQALPVKVWLIPLADLRTVTNRNLISVDGVMLMLRCGTPS